MINPLTGAGRLGLPFEFTEVLSFRVDLGVHQGWRNEFVDVIALVNEAA